jgi:hypothetical protein
MSAYRSIFLEPDWAHVLYYGWQDDWPEPGIRVLSKRQGPFRRHLVMNEGDDPSRAATILDNLRQGPLAETIFHDFTGGSAMAAMLRGRGFSPLTSEQRLLNVDTFAIDLEPAEEVLLARMSDDVRRKVRKAEREGLSVEAEDDPSDETIDGFVLEYGAMSNERGLRAPDPAVIRRMFRDGRSILFRVREDMQPPHYLVTYRAGDKAIFLYGVGRSKTNSGAGHLLQWSVVRALRERGIRWYDMGGLPAIGDQDGIYRFKRGFGGELVNLGSEHGRRAPLANLAKRASLVVGRFAGRRRP